VGWSEIPEEPEFEYDLEAEEEESTDSASGLVVAAVVGGVVLTGTLGFLVYRGLNSA